MDLTIALCVFTFNLTSVRGEKTSRQSKHWLFKHCFKHNKVVKHGYNRKHQCKTRYYI